jgi:hypothetical protein
VNWRCQSASCIVYGSDTAKRATETSSMMSTNLPRALSMDPILQNALPSVTSCKRQKRYHQCCENARRRHVSACARDTDGAAATSFFFSLTERLHRPGILDSAFDISTIGKGTVVSPSPCSANCTFPLTYWSFGTIHRLRNLS